MANYAIIIGINDYIPPERLGLKALQGAIRDAESVHEWVITHGGVTPERARLITSVLNPLAPLKQQVDAAIVEMMQDILVNGASADRLYFYFAGHGIGVERDLENNGLCTAGWNELFRNSEALSSKEYKQKFMNEGLFKEVVIWLDCCRNTKVYLDPAGGPGIIPNMGPNQNPQYFLGYATQFQNQAFETAAAANGEHRGVFTEVLLEGLAGAANENGQTPVTADELRDHLAYYVPHRAEAAGYIQIPEISHNATRYSQMTF
ncbi:caspase domain-containing protein [Mucilaginibacter angelicae]|uniref:Caspase domain-containing protein n=1 Tax=Mucilaginibacter angelicae TaxID=869718 RepID=A0ABV6L574_9SPHI